MILSANDSTLSVNCEQKKSRCVFSILFDNRCTTASILFLKRKSARTELQAGKSVSDVAAAKNVPINTVIAAVIAEQTTVLKQAVTDGKLTQEAADQRLATLKTNLPKLFELKGGMGGRGGRGSGNRPNGTAPLTSDQNGPTS